MFYEQCNYEISSPTHVDVRVQLALDFLWNEVGREKEIEFAVRRKRQHPFF